MRAFVICLAMVVSLLLGAACDDEGEDGLGDGGDDSGSLSAEEVIDEMLSGDPEVSLRVESIILDDWLADHAGSWSANYGVLIQVGEDRYTSNADVPESEVRARCGDDPEMSCLASLLEFCQESEDRCPADGALGEMLYLDDVPYYRGDDAAWLDIDPTCDKVCWHQAAEDRESRDEENEEGEFSVFDLLRDGEIIDDTPEGEVHIRARMNDPQSLDSPSASNSAQPTTDSPTIRPELLADLPPGPDRSEGTMDYWIETETYRAVRQEIHETYFNGEDVIGNTYTLVLFSDYNTAELPGPLPE